MTKTGRLFVCLTFALASWLTAGSAYALNDHSWVSSTGSGTTCTRPAPCVDFNAAQSATNPGGVISVIDPGDYAPFGGITITKSLTLRAAGVDGGGTESFPGGAYITVAAGASDVVTLEGLHLNGAGILFTSGAHLHIVRCVITNDNSFSTFLRSGIFFSPTSLSKLSVTDTVISNNGSSTNNSSGTGGGIVIKPESGGTAQVALERVAVMAMPLELWPTAATVLAVST
jgi:hypothetical protein